ncbi:TraR/DksA C4-type zinc finger protein [Dichelobacter nodosus]|uniref:TraR/DksA C4-type zinc finger protein n=1 Tax=Dichelobacter nodosus TaxID=870 RepID=UPI000681A24E|nr:TraR/DksA C4-type zinc finger protein [Dichelobacter nodosus]KNZ39963.1 hypothetical protein AKG33_01045 [Dichelobacter nodosus]
MDLNDYAAELEEYYRQESITKILNYSKVQNQSKTGRKSCIDCGEEIAVARRKVYPHAQRCVTCQIVAEKKNK